MFRDSFAHRISGGAPHGGTRSTQRGRSTHLVIMDIQLPNISGMELISHSKRDLSLARIPVLW
jgi:CheY-like chemotaxis protein